MRQLLPTVVIIFRDLCPILEHTIVVNIIIAFSDVDTFRVDCLLKSNCLSRYIDQINLRMARKRHLSWLCRARSRELRFLCISISVSLLMKHRRSLINNVPSVSTSSWRPLSRLKDNICSFVNDSMTFACNGLVLRKVPGRDDSQLEVKVMVPGTERSGAWASGAFGGAGTESRGINDDFDPRYGARMRDRKRSRLRQRPTSFRSGSSEFEGWHESSRDWHINST